MWLRSYPATGRVSAEHLLVCLPHAGGAASFFAPWAASLPARWRLLAATYPGRENRIADPPAKGIDELARGIADELLSKTHPGDDIVLFGHSMGGIVALEVARIVADRGGPLRLVAVSASSLSPSEARLSTRPGPGEPTLAAQLSALDPTFAQIEEYPELRDYALGLVSHDADLLAAWNDSGDPLPGTPLAVLTGQDDHLVPAVATQQWASATTGPLRSREFPGGHFYLRDRISEVAQFIVDTAETCDAEASALVRD